MRPLTLLLVVGFLLCPAALPAQASGYSPEQCPSCAAWNAPRAPVRLYGDVYWVGTQGLGAILLTSDAGHVLIDGGLPESAPLILDNVRTLGFRPDDIRIILNSHAHYDHAGGIAGLKRATGATVLASEASAAVMARGLPGADDPQYHSALPYPEVGDVGVISDGDTVRVGPLALVAHLTPGHAPGGMTWSWRSCDVEGCIHVVYADSQTPVSDDGFRFSGGDHVSEFERGLEAIAELRCDVLITPHPGASSLWRRIDARDGGDPNALIDGEACRRYADHGREQLARRVARERGGP